MGSQRKSKSLEAAAALIIIIIIEALETMEETAMDTGSKATIMLEAVATEQHAPIAIE